MSHREILVAASDSESREQMAESFREAGYDVETTDSTTHLFCSVLEKKIPVVLLGSGADKKIALSDLVPLLKKCNRRVTIILVSDEESLPTVRSIRQEGIFYHALPPTGEEDRAEILSAVECAFTRAEGVERDQRPPASVRGAADPAGAPTPPVVTAPGNGESEPRGIQPASRPGATGTPWYAPAALTVSLTAAIAVFVYAVVALFRGESGGGIVMWGFLGFCALVIVGRIIPALATAREAGRAAALHRHETGHEKEHA